MAVYRQFPNWLGQYLAFGTTRLNAICSRQDPRNFVIIGAIDRPNGRRIGWCSNSRHPELVCALHAFGSRVLIIDVEKVRC